MSSFTRTELPLLGGTGHGGGGRGEYECWAGLELGSWILECVV